LGTNQWDAVIEAVKRHPSRWLFAALCAYLLYRAVVKVGPVIAKAVVEDRQNRRKYLLDRERLHNALEIRKKKGDQS
jgi:hypothetical protein